MKTFLSLLLLLAATNTYAQYPKLRWVKGMGNAGEDMGLSLGVDTYGNVYSCGVFSNTVDFDPGPGVQNLVSKGDWDIFITRHDTWGNLVWAKSMGSKLIDMPHSITVEPSGTFYIAGKFYDTVDFDPGPGYYPLIGTGKENVFIAKYNIDGEIQWAKQISGTDYAVAMKVNFDKKGNVFACGSFREKVDFDPGPDTYYMDSKYLYDVFVLKLNQNGDFVWARQMGGAGSNDFGYSVGFDSAGNVYSSGYFWGTGDYDPGPGTFILSSRGGDGNSDIFISKLDSAGKFIWAKQITNNLPDSPADETNATMVVDRAGNCFLTGRVFDSADFDPGPKKHNLGSKGLEDAYVLKLDANGEYVWAVGIGGNAADYGNSLVLDTGGNVYLGGSFSRTVDFDPDPGGYYSMTSFGLEDAYIVKLDPNGKFIWAKQMGGTGKDGVYGIGVDERDNVYSTGYFQQTADFDPSAEAYNLSSGGTFDIFVHKMAGSILNVDEVVTGASVLLYPNPNNGQFVISVPAQEAGKINAEVYTVNGVLLLRQELNAPLNSIDISGQAPGIYFVRLVGEIGLLSVQKIVKL